MCLRWRPEADKYNCTFLTQLERFLYFSYALLSKGNAASLRNADVLLVLGLYVERLMLLYRET